MWKGFLDKGKCLLGFHAGPWQYRRAGDCAQAMTCARCGVESQRIEHQWTAWAYRVDDACDLVRACTRCAQTEQRVEHVWGEPEYVKSHACERVGACTRCRAREPRGVAHAFSRWEYRDADSCAQLHSCARCGERGTDTRVHHAWSEWADSAYYATRVRVCGHCGEMTLAIPGVNADATPSMQAAGAAVDGLLAAKGWEDVRACLTRNRRVLLTPVAEGYCQFALDHYELDDEARQALVGARRLVELSREKGIDGALQALGAVATPEAPAPPPTAAPASTPPDTPAGHRPLDSRLVGHWRSTEHLGGGGISMSTDTHCALDRHGDFAWWSHTVGPAGSSETARQMGRWEAHGERLVLRFTNGESLTRDYLVDGNGMVWPRDGRYRYWTQVAW